MEGAKPAVAMVALQLLFSALQIFIQLALDDGMDARVLVAYRFMFDAAVLCPIAFFVERFTINHNLYVLAIKFTSATFVTAISNLTPAATFILAILARSETSKLWKPTGQAKLLGTLVGIFGAMLLIFYKGPEITTLRRLSHPRLVHSTKGYRSHPPSAGHQVLGSLLGTISCFSCATWFVIQRAWLSPNCGRAVPGVVGAKRRKSQMKKWERNQFLLLTPEKRKQNDEVIQNRAFHENETK